MYTVYKHINKVNGKQYVGLTKQSPENRWGKDGMNYKGKCSHFWAAIQKYGWNNFTHVIVADGLNQKEACELEIKLIKENKSNDKDYGYNILEGGTAPSIPDEIRKKISTALMGNKNGQGHPCSAEKRKKIGDAQRGRKFSQSRRDAISRAKRGKKTRPCSDELKRKISEGHAAHKKKVYCLTNNTVYPSIQECAKTLGIDATYVCACCKGRVKRIHGYEFKYYDEIHQKPNDYPGME